MHACLCFLGTRLSTAKNHDFLQFTFSLFIPFHVYSVQRTFTSKSWIHSVILSLTAGHFILLFLPYCIVMLVQTDFVLRQNFLSSNVMRLRDFIKHVYVDRRYSGDRNFDKPPRGKTVRCHKLLLSCLNF